LKSEDNAGKKKIKCKKGIGKKRGGGLV